VLLDLDGFGSAVETGGDPVAAFCRRDGGKTVERLEARDVQPAWCATRSWRTKASRARSMSLLGQAVEVGARFAQSGKPTRRDDVGA
jgi:hypothetical protein